MEIIPKERKRESLFLCVFFWSLLAVFCDKMSDRVFAGLIGAAFTGYVVGRAYTEKPVPESNQK